MKFEEFGVYEYQGNPFLVVTTKNRQQTAILVLLHKNDGNDYEKQFLIHVEIRNTTQDSKQSYYADFSKQFCTTETLPLVGRLIGEIIRQNIGRRVVISERSLLFLTITGVVGFYVVVRIDEKLGCFMQQVDWHINKWKCTLTDKICVEKTNLEQAVVPVAKNIHIIVKEPIKQGAVFKVQGDYVVVLQGAAENESLAYKSTLVTKMSYLCSVTDDVVKQNYNKKVDEVIVFFFNHYFVVQCNSIFTISKIHLEVCFGGLYLDDNYAEIINILDFYASKFLKPDNSNLIHHIQQGIVCAPRFMPDYAFVDGEGIQDTQTVPNVPPKKRFFITLAATEFTDTQHRLSSFPVTIATKNSNGDARRIHLNPDVQLPEASYAKSHQIFQVPRNDIEKYPPCGQLNISGQLPKLLAAFMDVMDYGDNYRRIHFQYF